MHVHQSALTTGSGGGRSRLGFDTANRTLAFCGTSPGRANQRRSHVAHADTHIARTRVQTNTDTTYFVFWAADVILNTKHRWKLATCVFDLSQSVLMCQCLSFLLTCSPSSTASLSFVSRLLSASHSACLMLPMLPRSLFCCRVHRGQVLDTICPYLTLFLLHIYTLKPGHTHAHSCQAPPGDHLATKPRVPPLHSFFHFSFLLLY